MRGAFMGERSAVRPKSGQSVRQSDPALRRPTPPSTPGRKPAAGPPVHPHLARRLKSDAESREAGGPQRKTARGAGWTPAGSAQREALGSFRELAEFEPVPSYALDDSQITTLIQFFQTL